MQPAVFHAKARLAFQMFPDAARKALGEAIGDLQHGAMLGMPLSRPMPSILAGVYELRVKDSAGTYRAFYLLKSERGVLVFHAFEKRTQKTPPQEIELGRKRLKEMMHEKS
jgi:phage-related protein